MKNSIMLKVSACHLLLLVGAGTLLAAERSADQVAKELSNPAGSLASLFTSFEYTLYKGDLPDADDQDGWGFSFQPVLPFPVGDKGRNITFRPLVPVPINKPVFDTGVGEGKPIKVHDGHHTTYVVPGIGEFEDGDLSLGDISFDLVYAGNEMTDEHSGFLWGVGAAGTLPTATDDDFAGDQWRLGPEVFGGVLRKWGAAGLVLNHQWDVAGSGNDGKGAPHSVTAGQYFYAIGLGKGWQIASGPNFAYDWKADSDQAWTFPIGTGIAKTTGVGKTKVKFQVQVQYFLEQPDVFGPEWLFKFTATPVIANPFVKLYR
jgi:hypothetical protein